MQSPDELPLKTPLSKPSQELWDEIGFHRPLAGFWYNLVFTLLGMLASILISGVFISYFYPFPEAIGYRNVISDLFVLIFMIFDLGTHMTMSRYIAEVRIKNPRKVIQYVQYFIWYQMFTGLIQVTIISVYALYFVPRGELAYTMWLMLILGSKQYPGFLGVFRGTLGALQQYNKVAVLNFISSQIFQRATEIIFVLLGRWYGLRHPEMGEIMGVAIGSMVGLYIDDFLATLLSARYFSKVMAGEGIRARDCFKIQFDWILVKDVFFFGVRTGISSLTGVFANFMILNLFLEYIPQYTTFKALMMIGTSVGGIMGWAYAINITPQLSESYLNGKKYLAQYYFAQAIRFGALIQGFMIPLIVILTLILPDIFTFLDLERYLLGLVFIIPFMLNRIITPYLRLTDVGLAGTNHPTAHMVITTVTDFLKILQFYIYLPWLQLPDKYGTVAIIIILSIGELPCYYFQFFAGHWYIHKKVFPIRVPWKQVLVAIPIAEIITFCTLYLEKLLFFDLVYKRLSRFWIGIVLFVFASLITVLFLYFPLTGLFGGWDKNNMEDFRKSMEMSGPSKFIVKPLYRLVLWGTSHSKFQAKMELNLDEAMKEAGELILTRNNNRFKSGNEE